MQPINQIQRLRRQSNFKDSLIYRKAYKALYNQESFIRNIILNTSNLEREFDKKHWFAVYCNSKLECLLYGKSEQLKVFDKKTIENLLYSSYNITYHTHNFNYYRTDEDFTISTKEVGLIGHVLLLDKLNSKESFKLSKTYSKTLYKFKKLNRFKLLKHLNNF